MGAECFLICLNAILEKGQLKRWLLVKQTSKGTLMPDLDDRIIHDLLQGIPSSLAELVQVPDQGATPAPNSMAATEVRSKSTCTPLLRPALFSCDADSQFARIRKPSGFARIGQ